MKNRFNTFLTFLMVVTAIEAHSQKLPNKQETSVYAPANIKIDGKANEWDATFQAYNHATDIFYTISNDDNNLYLTVHATDPNVIRRIFTWGIKFSVAPARAKTDKDAAVITYPFFEKDAAFAPALKSKPEIIPGSDASLKLADSFMYVTNKKMLDKIKLIKVTGIKTLDTLLSIYNENGIRAAGLFDNKMAYTYELAIPLKILHAKDEVVISTDHSKFAYHLLINDILYPGTYAMKDKVTGQMIYVVNPPEFAHPIPTDFWGEYTLAKKQ